MIHRDLTVLDPQMRAMATIALERMRADATLNAAGVTEILISETLRELPVQMAYYSRSRMSVKDVHAMYGAAHLSPITDAEASSAITWTLDSNHLRGIAIDIVPIKDGHPWWTAPYPVWERMGQIGEEAGLAWGGRWIGHKDCPHFELKR